MNYLKWYFKFYNFIAANRIKKSDLDLRRIHSHNAVVFSTGIMMWAYAFLAYFTISSPVPGIIGFACSAVHLLSPLLFRISNNAFSISNLMIGSGMIHQGSFAYFTGGYKSHLLIWYGILPMLGGIIAGRRGALFWAKCTISVSGAFLILDLTGYNYPNLITASGDHLAHSLLVFGWIFLSTSIIYVLLILNEQKEKLLSEQGEKIDDLFRVLFHDLAGPLNRVSIGLSLLKRNGDEESRLNGLDIATKASDAMLEITQNVRKMYSVSKGRGKAELTYFALNEAIEYIHRLNETELGKKNLTLDYDFKQYQGLKFLVEPVSFKNQVLGNIFSNAIKFSHPGSSIRVQVTQIEKNYFSLEISDSGIGMPEYVLKSVFDVNKKTSRPGTAGEIGTGFGMQIMKSFVEMYQGKVLIDTTVQKGTTIKLLLSARWDVIEKQEEAPFKSALPETH